MSIKIKDDTSKNEKKKTESKRRKSRSNLRNSSKSTAADNIPPKSEDKSSKTRRRVSKPKATLSKLRKNVTFALRRSSDTKSSLNLDKHIVNIKTSHAQTMAKKRSSELANLTVDTSHGRVE